MAEQGLFDFLNRATMNPLFMGGLGLLSGGGGQGAMQGMQQGLMAQRQMTQDQELQQRKAAYQQAVQQGLFKDLPGGLGAMAPMMTPDQAIGLMGDFGKAKYGSDLNVSEKKQIMPLELAQRLAIINAQSAAELGAHKNKVQWDAANNPMVQADLGLKNAHARYYDSVGGARVQQQERLLDDQMRKSAMARDVFGRLGANPTEQQWNAMQPYLVQINDGQPVPYGQRGPFLMRVQEAGRDPLDPTEAEKLAGITRENKLQAYRQAKINELYGAKDAQLMNKGVRLRPDGTMETIPGSGNTVSERNAEILANQGLAQLDKAETKLNESTWLGRAAGDRWSIPGTKLEVGGFGDAGRGFAAAHGAVLNYLFALSGKNVTDKEQARFEKLYLPTSMDSEATRSDKLQTLRTVLMQVKEARKAGAGDEKIGEMFRSFLNNPNVKPVPNGGDRAGGKGAEDLRGLSTEELLKRLR